LHFEEPPREGLELLPVLLSAANSWAFSQAIEATCASCTRIASSSPVNSPLGDRAHGVHRQQGFSQDLELSSLAHPFALSPLPPDDFSQ
jgi:hypothetical protein